MKNKKSIQKIIIGLALAIGLLVVYSLFAPKDPNSNSATPTLSSLLDNQSSAQIVETDVALANAEILKVLGSIQNIELNDDIFTDPTFKKLKDTQFTIPKPTKIGRTNPFLPIGFDGLSSSSIPTQPSTTTGSILDIFNQNQVNQEVDTIQGNQDFFDNSSDSEVVNNVNELNA